MLLSRERACGPRGGFTPSAAGRRWRFPGMGWRRILKDDDLKEKSVCIFSICVFHLASSCWEYFVLDLLAVFCFRCLWSLSPTWQLLSASEALSGFNGRTAKDLHLNHVLHFKSFPPFKGYCGHVTSSRNDCLQGNIRSQTAEGFSWTCSWGFFASRRFHRLIFTLRARCGVAFFSSCGTTKL